MSNDPLLELLGLCEGNYDLDNAKSILVDTHLVQILVDLFEDELLVFVVKAAALEDFADYMCPLLIYGQIAHIALQGLLDKSFFLRHGDVVKDGLNGVRALLVTADIDEVVLDAVKDTKPLLNGAAPQ